mgnify:CR=1 FL=1
MSAPEPPKPTSINEKITNLDKQIEWFYSDDFSLDSASEKYKKTVYWNR